MLLIPQFEVHARIPRVEMIARYKIDGRVLVLPITGNGKSNLTLGKFLVLLNLEFIKLITFFNRQTMLTSK